MTQRSRSKRGRKQLNFWHRSLLALLAGALYPLAFEPLAMRPLALISLAVFWGVIYRESVKTAAGLGFVFGLSAFGVGVSWVYVSMVTFGGMIPVMAVIAVILLVAYLAIYPALFAGLSAVWAGRLGAVWTLLGVMPAIWVFSEAIRGWLLTGFPWLLLGYAALDTPYQGWAPIQGVMGVSWVLGVTAGAVLWSVIARGKQVVLSLAVIVAALAGGWGLSLVDWSEPAGKPLRAAIVQENISIWDKWNPKKRDEIQDAYWLTSADIEADLIVWPEGAIPVRLDQIEPEYLMLLEDLEGALSFGVVERVPDANAPDNGKHKVYNSIVLLSDAWRQGKSIAPVQAYRKAHLVPFGEYFPLPWLLGGLLRSLQIPMSDFSSWRSPQLPLMVNDARMLSTICYEAAFPEVWRQGVPGSNLLLNISEDAWFGDSLAPHQRLEMARFRSLEMARPMLRSSNTGLSALIDEKGRLLAAAPQFEKAVLAVDVQPVEGVTPYVRWGRAPLYAWLAVLLLMAFFLANRINIQSNITKT